MIRRLIIATAILALVALAAAQGPYTIDPTTGEGSPDAIAMGATEAAVGQDVTLILPQATALHLDATTISFDLRSLAAQWDRRAQGLPALGTPLPYQCVYSEGADVTAGLGSDFWGQTQTIPGGIAYAASDYPQITISGEPVVNYPPLKLDADGELVDGSKNYIVCYQSFIIQLFSNFDHWDLQVSRNDTGENSIEHLYVQGNVCSDFGTPTGLYALPDNSGPVHLIPKSLNAGTTGDRVNATCGNTNTSWLDVLGVLAVKINSDSHGTSVANLTYTLVSSDSSF